MPLLTMHGGVNGYHRCVSGTSDKQWVIFDNFRLTYLVKPAPVVVTTQKVSLAEGTEEADNWKVKAGDATEFGDLPVEGVPEGTTVTLKYNGTCEMKSITAKVKGATGALADNPEVSPVAGKTNEWSFTMPAGDVEMEILYKTQSQLVLTFGGEEITSDGVTGYMSFEEEFSSSLSFSIEGLDAAMGFTFESSDATVMAFGDIYADADAATAAGTTALVKIAYVGSATGNATYNHGLAISLADEAKMKYGAAKTACSDKNTSAPVARK